jgi:hypothetical protein
VEDAAWFFGYADRLAEHALLEGLRASGSMRRPGLHGPYGIASNRSGKRRERGQTPFTGRLKVLQPSRGEP